MRAGILPPRVGRRRRSGGSGAFAVLAISLAMIVLGALLLITWNGERLLARWSSAAEFSVYLRDDATSEERGAIEAIIDQSGVGAARVNVSKAEALTRFRREFTDWRRWPRTSTTICSFGRSQAAARGRGRRPCHAVVKRLGSAAGVADVGYDSEWWVALLAPCEPCAVPVWLWRC